MEAPRTFVEEIDYSEIEILEVVGKGSFGVVNKGKWRGKFVAVKKIEGESEKKAFIVERQQLSRVNHPNIVRLYGACTKSPVCLVMEYAEGGSLYNVLHVTPRAHYTAAHAMSWALQCAKGVSYLHDMKPKALVHRDLKPPNLLLIMGGTVLKICDFGTACDLQTHMTNNKGSAAWMAPEVFEGSSYSEKCDVFSWGIILWEVLTRQKPFGDHGATAFSIMWAVHSGQRPPLIRGCPLQIEKLMTSCWDKVPNKRPSMGYVVEIMVELFKYFKGADKPITFTPSDDENGSSSVHTDELGTVSEESLGISISNKDALSEAYSPANAVSTNDSKDQKTSPKPPTSLLAERNISPSVMQPITVVVDEKTTPSPSELVVAPRLVSQTSAPPSLASSQENLSSQLKDINQKRFSADLSPVNTLASTMEQLSVYKKTGSVGSLLSNTTEPTPLYVPISSRKDVKPERLPPPHLFSPSKPGLSLPPFQRLPPPPPLPPSFNSAVQDFPATCEFYHLMLEPEYQPLPPYTKSPESMKVFEEHKAMAYDYIRVKAELDLLLKRKQELAEELSRSRETVSTGAYTEADKFINEIMELQNERLSLRTLHNNLLLQLEMLKKPKERSDGWVMLP